MNIYADISRLMDTYGSSRAPTHEENHEHFKRLLTCDDETGLNAYAAANIRMVVSVITKFIKRHRSAVYLIDDLFSTGLCTMLSSLKALVKQARENPDEFWDVKSGLGKLDEEGRFSVSMYIYISLYRNIQLCYEEDAVQAISKSTSSRFTPKGEGKPIHKVSGKRSVLESKECDPFSTIYLLDDILELCETDFERDIVKMRITMGDPEISESLGCCQQWIQKARQRINERYKQSLLKDLE